MRMTQELAGRVLERRDRKRDGIPETLREAILQDWLDGLSYAEMKRRHRVSTYCISSTVARALKAAEAVRAAEALKKRRKMTSHSIMLLFE